MHGSVAKVRVVGQSFLAWKGKLCSDEDTIYGVIMHLIKRTGLHQTYPQILRVSALLILKFVGEFIFCVNINLTDL